VWFSLPGPPLQQLVHIDDIDTTTAILMQTRQENRATAPSESTNGLERETELLVPAVFSSAVLPPSAVARTSVSEPVATMADSAAAVLSTTIVVVGAVVVSAVVVLVKEAGVEKQLPATSKHQPVGPMQNWYCDIQLERAPPQSYVQHLHQQVGARLYQPRRTQHRTSVQQSVDHQESKV
jgi:hypothetical protein